MAKRNTYTREELKRILEDHKHWWNECSSGIHFFVDREEAVSWLLRQ